MRKIFSLFVTLIAAIAMNAATVVNFDFSDASAYGYTNPAKGAYTQVPNNGTITKDGVTITIAFTEGNGFRFFSHSNTGAINLRGYNNASFTIAAPEGKKLAAISADGTNLTSAYLSGGMTSAQWSSQTGVASLTTNVIQSTVQFNSLDITVIDEGEVPPTPENIKVDVAGAIAAGMALDSAKTSADVYEVTGYVVNAEPFNKSYGNQIWWMSDNAENTAAQEFEAYSCTVSKNDTLMQVLNGDKVTLTGKITKYYDKTAEKFIIEIKNGTAVFISMAEGDHSIDGGTPAEKVDTITVAKALEIGQALADKAVSPKEYVVKGYVSSIQDYYSEEYGNETFWITDSLGARTSDKTKAFEVYRGKPNTQKEIGLDALIQIKCKIKNYGGTIENDGSGITFEVLEQGKPVETDTVSVAEALAIGMALDDNAYTDNPYVVVGFVTKAFEPDSGYTNQNFYMADEPDAHGDFYAFRTTCDSKVKDGDYVQLFGKIQKYVKGDKTTIELSYGSAKHVDAPELQTLTVAQVQALDLAEGATTVERFIVIGYVAAITSDYEEDLQSFNLSDDAAATTGDFTCIDAKIAEPGAVLHDQVKITGKIQKMNGKFRMVGGKAVVVNGEGLENIVLTEKAQKIMIDGVVYIIRDNKIFNLQGTQVR